MHFTLLLKLHCTLIYLWMYYEVKFKVQNTALFIDLLLNKSYPLEKILVFPKKFIFEVNTKY